MNHAPRTLAVALGLAMAQWACAEQGLALPDAVDPLPQWQARLGVLLPLGAVAPAAEYAQGLKLSGDRYFRFGRWSDRGALRATSTLWVGSRNGLSLAPSAFGRQPWLLSSSAGSWVGTGEAQEHTTAGFLGLGYTMWSARNQLGLSADLGLAGTLSGSPWRMGLPKVRLGEAGGEDSRRPWLFTPLLQVNLSYAF
ncbi:hypothetical protein [Ideonella livida]|uniref:DUF3575 domain-containing protein n=1 Tax=Ideonella livida TaxID=2707176 RepID=A0A7C9PK75_9BURK|nr:hypothetical protein [Ideonella livida]NDY93072.1 hypothetical protein [Ideonella livida]